MTAIILQDAEDDLERAFDYYELRRTRLGHEMIEEFRRGLDRVLVHPRAWQSLDETYRRYRLHRFPYGIIYRIDVASDQIVIVAFSNLAEAPGQWRNRGRRT